MAKNILILGGTGMQAESMVMDLLAIDTENISGITLASRNEAALKARVEKLGDPRVRYMKLDMNDHDALVSAMKKHDLVMNTAASPTVFLGLFAALEAGVDLLGMADIAGPPFPGKPVPTDEWGHTRPEFIADLSDKFEKAGLTCSLGWGYMPGTLNMIGRLTCDRFDTIDSINFYIGTCCMGDSMFFSECPGEVPLLYNLDSAPVYKDGRFTMINPMEDREKMTFPDPIGEILCQHYPYMSTIPDFVNDYADKGVKNVDLRLGYWPGYLEKMDFLRSVGMLDMQPKEINGVKIAPYTVFLSGPGVATHEGLNVEDYGCTSVVVEGMINGHKTRYCCEAMGRPIRGLGSMQILTGIPAAIGIQSYCKGLLTKKGLYTPQDKSIDPTAFLKELGRRGFRIATTGTEVLSD